MATTPNNRALVEALKLYRPQMREVLPWNLRNHLDQFFGLAEKISWDDAPTEDGSIRIDPQHLKPTVYTGRMRWLTKLTRWKGPSQAEYEEKTLQQEVLVYIGNQWYQEWIPVAGSVECIEVEGDPSFPVPKSVDPASHFSLGSVNLADMEVKAIAHAWTGGACSLCGEPQFKTDSGVTCSNGHGGAPAVEGSGDPAVDGDDERQAFYHLIS